MQVMESVSYDPLIKFLELAEVNINNNEKAMVKFSKVSMFLVAI